MTMKFFSIDILIIIWGCRIPFDRFRITLKELTKSTAQLAGSAIIYATMPVISPCPDKTCQDNGYNYKPYDIGPFHIKRILYFFLFMAISAQAFFPLVSIHFALFTFFTAGHITSLFCQILIYM